MVSSAKLDDYITAHEAAQILSRKNGRTIRTDYISKMAKMRKYRIRCKKVHDIYLYHRGDIENCPPIGARGRLKRIAMQVMKHVAVL